jgi:hypothetical protein
MGDFFVSTSKYSEKPNKLKNNTFQYNLKNIKYKNIQKYITYKMRILLLYRKLGTNTCLVYCPYIRMLYNVLYTHVRI